MEELFYPHLSMSLRATSPGSRSAPQLLRVLLHVLPTALMALTVMGLFNLGRELQLQHHGRFDLAACSCALPDVTPIPAVTTTVYAHPARSVPPSASDASGSRPAPARSPPPPLPTPSPAAGKPTIPTITPRVESDETSLFPVDALPFPWPLRFDVPPAARQAARKVLEGLAVFWQIVRVAYHYPLPPPP